MAFPIPTQNPYLAGLMSGMASQPQRTAPATMTPQQQADADFENAVRRNYAMQRIMGGENTLPSQYSTGVPALDLALQRRAQREYGWNAARDAVAFRQAEQKAAAEAAAKDPNAVREVGGQRFAFRDGKPVGFSSPLPPAAAPTMTGPMPLAENYGRERVPATPGVSGRFKPEQQTAFDRAIANAFKAAQTRQAAMTPQETITETVTERVPMGPPAPTAAAPDPKQAAMLANAMNYALRNIQQPAPRVDPMEVAREESRMIGDIERMRPMQDQKAELYRQLEDVRARIRGELRIPGFFGSRTYEASPKQRQEALAREKELIKEIQALEKKAQTVAKR